MAKIVAFVAVVVAAAFYWYVSGDGFEPGSIAGKRVLVTGASSGIGEQLAYHYSRLGARLAIVARRAHRLALVASECRRLGAQQVTVVTADLGDAADRRRVMRAVRKDLGGLDQLVLNHAVLTFGKWSGSADNLTTFASQLDVNFVSYVDLASQALDLLLASKGRLGVVSSIAGKIAFPTTASYCADKFALQGFFSSLRQELRRRDAGVSVTICVLGSVDTDIAKFSAEQKRRLSDNAYCDLRVSPSDAASAILRAVTTRQPEFYNDRITAALVTLHALFPRWAEHFLGRMFDDFY